MVEVVTLCEMSCNCKLVVSFEVQLTNHLLTKSDWLILIVDMYHGIIDKSAVQIPQLVTFTRNEVQISAWVLPSNS